MAEEFAMPPSQQYPYGQTPPSIRPSNVTSRTSKGIGQSRGTRASTNRSRVIGQGRKLSLADETARLEMETRNLAARLRKLTPYQANRLGRFVFRKHPNQVEILSQSHQKIIELIFKTAIKTERQADVSALIDKLLSHSSEVGSVATPTAPRPAVRVGTGRKVTRKPSPPRTSTGNTLPSIRRPTRQGVHQSAIQSVEPPSKTEKIASGISALGVSPQLDPIAKVSDTPSMTSPVEVNKQVTLLLSFDGRHDFRRLRAQLQTLLPKLGIVELEIHNIVRIYEKTQVLLSFSLPENVTSTGFVESELKKVSLPITDVSQMATLSIDAQNFWRHYLPKETPPKLSA